MAHFAKVNKETNLVEHVIVATQNHINSLDDHEDWVQTSYNNNFRNVFACIGAEYDRVNDIFIHPKPFDSWVLNTEGTAYVAPVEKPDTHTDGDGGVWSWNETNLAWDWQADAPEE